MIRDAPFPLPWEPTQGMQKGRTLLGLLISFASLVVEKLSFSHQYIPAECFVFLSFSARDNYCSHQNQRFITKLIIVKIRLYRLRSVLILRRAQKIPI